MVRRGECSEVPQADSCTAANIISIRSPRRRGREPRATNAVQCFEATWIWRKPRGIIPIPRLRQNLLDDANDSAAV